MIGWAGADGIHYCFIRGFGDMVFSVSPQNANPNYVHPLAENFEDFLKLLLACGDAAALEQAWMWEEAQFLTFLRDNPPTQEQSAVLAEVAKELCLTPMENSWRYVRNLQSSFDYAKIKYTDDFYDPDMNVHADLKAPEWEVYFDSNFWGHSTKDRAGEAIGIGRRFLWAGKNWHIPAVYTCGKGLVVDICMQIEPDQIRAFMEKWDLRCENEGANHFSHEQRMEIDRDNPLSFDFTPMITLNGKELFSSHGCGISHNPCVPDEANRNIESKWIIDHYGLDPAYGWWIWRAAFPWKTKRKPIMKALSITMDQHPVPIPGPHFRANKLGDTFSFTLPETGVAHALTVRDYSRQVLPDNCFGAATGAEFPKHYSMMRYTVDSEVIDGAVMIEDCAESDKPKKAQSDTFAPESVNCASVGIIGGADGPTSIILGESEHDQCRTVASSLHFEPVDDVEWRIVFQEKGYDGLSVRLI